MNVGLNTNNRQAFGCTNCHEITRILTEQSVPPSNIEKYLNVVAPKSNPGHKQLAFNIKDALKSMPGQLKIIADNVRKNFNF